MGLLFVKQEELNSRDCLIYACDTMPEGTLFKKAEREGNDETAIDIYLKVGENQGVFVLRDGKIYEFSFLKGIFKIDPTLPPSRIFGKLPKEALDVNSALQHTFPQFSDGDYIYFVNLVPQTEIEFITDEPFTFYVNNKYDPLYIAGSYFVKIFDPFKLFVKIVRNKESCYTLTETFINRITSDVMLGLQEKTICLSEEKTEQQTILDNTHILTQYAMETVQLKPLLGIGVGGIEIRAICFESSLPDADPDETYEGDISIDGIEFDDGTSINDEQDFAGTTEDEQDTIAVNNEPNESVEINDLLLESSDDFEGTSDETTEFFDVLETTDNAEEFFADAFNVNESKDETPAPDEPQEANEGIANYSNEEINNGEKTETTSVEQENTPEETVAEETVAEETVAEETVAEETVVEEASAEETVVEEASAEETQEEAVIPEPIPESNQDKKNRKKKKKSKNKRKEESNMDTNAVEPNIVSADVAEAITESVDAVMQETTTVSDAEPIAEAYETSFSEQYDAENVEEYDDAPAITVDFGDYFKLCTGDDEEAEQIAQAFANLPPKPVFDESHYQNNNLHKQLQRPSRNDDGERNRISNNEIATQEQQSPAQQSSIPQQPVIQQPTYPTFGNNINTRQQPATQKPQYEDFNLEGLNLAFSDMSAGPQPQTTQSFNNTKFPFQDDEWLCPVCFNEVNGEFCGCCGQKRLAPRFGIPTMPQAQIQWNCFSCGFTNTTKFCSNCGRSRDEMPKLVCDVCGWKPDNIANPPKFCPECGTKYR